MAGRTMFRRETRAADGVGRVLSACEGVGLAPTRRQATEAWRRRSLLEGSDWISPGDASDSEMVEAVLAAYAPVDLPTEAALGIDRLQAVACALSFAVAASALLASGDARGALLVAALAPFVACQHVVAMLRPEHASVASTGSNCVVSFAAAALSAVACADRGESLAATSLAAYAVACAYAALVAWRALAGGERARVG